MVNRLYQKYAHMNGTVHSKAVEVEDLSRSGRPSASSTKVKIAKVKEMVTENRHLSLREIAAEISVSHESIRTILNDCLGMKPVATRLVRKDLTFLQKLNRVKAKNSTNIIEHPPYSPDMAWSTFLSFQNSNYHFEAPVSVDRWHKREFTTTSLT